MQRTHLKSTRGFSIPPIYTKFAQYPRITNYVATVFLGVKIDLNSIALSISSANREPDQFAAITIRIGKATTLLFSSGKMVIAGARTEYDSYLAAHICRLMVEQTEHPFYDPVSRKFHYSTLEKYTEFKNFTIQNIVANTQVTLAAGPSRERINLNQIDEYVGQTATSLNAEIFPGLRYFIERSPECPIQKEGLMAYIFAGAKVVIMGANVMEDIYISYDHLRKILEPYLKMGENKNSISFMYKNIAKMISTLPAGRETAKTVEPSMNYYEDPEEMARALCFVNDFFA